MLEFKTCTVWISSFAFKFIVFGLWSFSYDAHFILSMSWPWTTPQGLCFSDKNRSLVLGLSGLVFRVYPPPLTPTHPSSTPPNHHHDLTIAATIPNTRDDPTPTTPPPQPRLHRRAGQPAGGRAGVPHNTPRRAREPARDEVSDRWYYVSIIVAAPVAYS